MSFVYSFHAGPPLNLWGSHVACRVSLITGTKWCRFRTMVLTCRTGVRLEFAADIISAGQRDKEPCPAQRRLLQHNRPFSDLGRGQTSCVRENLLFPGIAMTVDFDPKRTLARSGSYRSRACVHGADLNCSPEYTYTLRPGYWAKEFGISLWPIECIDHFAVRNIKSISHEIARPHRACLAGATRYNDQRIV